MGFIELNVLNPSSSSRAPALGIDLGTTNSLAAEWREGHGVVLHREGQSGIVPSALYFPEDGEPIVGAQARALAREDPLHALFSIKRFMGRGLRDVAGELDTVPCPVRETAYGVIQFEMRGRLYTPQELSALILRRVLAVAGRDQQDERVRAVITVPAYFDDTQRQATRDAARLAEIDVLRIVNEPTAASLAYGLDEKSEGTVAVYDLGGGTFDVSILAIEDGVFRVLATAGDTHLGGDDFDRALGERALERFGDAIDPEIRSDPAFRLALRLAAEKCKIALSRDPTADVVLSLPSAGVQGRAHIERADFETWIAPMIQRTLAFCGQALLDAGVTAKQIDEIVLVGGSTRIPAVRRAVEAFFGRKPHTELNPDEVVALGASAQAHVLSGGTREFLLMDVTPLSLGIETIGGATSKIIQRNSTIPCEASETFTTYADNQTGIDFNIVQGERELASDCRSLGRFKLSGIPPMPAGMARVRVRFHIDADGLLTVSAVEEKSGQSAHIEVQPLNGLTDDEVERMLRESFENARSDFDRRRIADLHVELGTMIAATHKGLASAGGQLDAETREDIRSALQRAEEASRLVDLEKVQRARDELERATLSLAALLMDNVARAALAGKTLDQV